MVYIYELVYIYTFFKKPLLLILHHITTYPNHANIYNQIQIQNSYFLSLSSYPSLSLSFASYMYIEIYIYIDTDTDR